jgi:membrane associated rhomboid family serine protease
MANRQHITVTNGLILLCIIAYFLESQFIKTGLSGYELVYFENSQFQPIQLLSHMFLHGSTTHLMFNMLGLWMFGNSVELVFGYKKFLTFYFLCGIGAAAVYLGFNYYQFQTLVNELLISGINRDTLFEAFEASKYFPQLPQSEEATIIFNTPVVGASGAVYGVLVAFAFIFPNHKIMLIFLPIPIAAKIFVPVLLSIDLLSEFTGFAIFGQNIAHSAHIGGAITALLLLFTIMRRKKIRPY